MNKIKQYMLKNYIKKRKEYFIAFGIALISVILVVVALIVDELTFYTESLTDTKLTCGCVEGVGVKYADCADIIGTEDPCKKAQTAGILWIVFLGIGMLCCFIAPALLRVKKSLSFIPYIFTVICYPLAIILWVGDNPFCYAKDLDPSIGTSIILVVVATVFAVIALVVAAYPKFKGS